MGIGVQPTDLLARLPDGPERPLRKEELKALVQASDPEDGLIAFGWLSGDEPHRQAQVALYREVTTWHHLASDFGYGLQLCRALPDVSSPELTERKRALESLVRASTPRDALSAFEQLRPEEIPLYQRAASWHHLAGDFGYALQLARALREQPEREQELERMVRVSTPKDALRAFENLPAARLPVYQMAAGWHHLASDFGHAQMLAEALPEPDADDFAPRRDQLRALVAQNGPREGLEAARFLWSCPPSVQTDLAATLASLDLSLGGDGKADFSRLRTLSSGNAWQQHLFALGCQAHQVPEEIPQPAWLSLEEARALQLPPDRALELLAVLDPNEPQDVQRLAAVVRDNALPAREASQLVELIEPPRGGALGETDDHWLIAGTVIKKKTETETIL